MTIVFIVPQNALNILGLHGYRYENVLFIDLRIYRRDAMLSARERVLKGYCLQFRSATF